MSDVTKTTKTTTAAEKAAEAKETVKAVANTAEKKAKTAAKAAETTAKKAEEKVAKKAKEVKTAKRTYTRRAAKPETSNTQVLLQFAGNEAEVNALEQKVKDKFIAEGHRAGNIKELTIYVKPEEYKAYYVINGGKFTGDVDLF